METPKKDFTILKKPKRSEIFAAKGWRCCQCKKRMSRGESNCTNPKCGHSKCRSCAVFEI